MSRDVLEDAAVAHYPEDVEELCSMLTMLVDGRTHDLGPLRSYLDQQRRLGHIELVGPGGTSTQVALHEPLDIGGDIHCAAKRAGIALTQKLRSIEVKPPGLRDLLRRDRPARRSRGTRMIAIIGSFGAERIVRVVERDLRPGGVILMHDSAPDVVDGDSRREQTVTALEELVPRLLHRGYAFDLPALPADRGEPNGH